MNLKIKKFELNKETISHLTQEDAKEVHGGAQTTVSIMTKNADSGCPTRCNHYYCIC